jgi:hypothetical protein
MNLPEGDPKKLEYRRPMDELIMLSQQRGMRTPRDRPLSSPTEDLKAVKSRLQYELINFLLSHKTTRDLLPNVSWDMMSEEDWKRLPEQFQY